MLKLLITRELPERVVEAARARFDVTLRDRSDPLDRAELEASLRDFDLILPTLGDAYSAEIFAAASQPRARLLANFGVGYNHIDAEAARRAGVAVSNTPGAVTDATADIGIMLMLMACRRASEGERLVRDGSWQGWSPVQLLGLHMTGKTLGVVGMGRIGQAIARRAHFGFGMEVRYFNRSPKTPDFPAERVSDLESLAAQVDVLVVALPGGAETRGLIGAEVFDAMPPHARFVNIARGDIVDEAALIDALEAGKIGGAGLDVYENEPQLPDRLRALPNVSLLPHLGTAALEVREKMGFMALDNIIAVAEGREPPNAV